MNATGTGGTGTPRKGTGGTGTYRTGPAGKAFGVKAAMAGERALFLRAHPVAYPLLRGLARLGPVVRLPRIGVVVNDAALARDVLLDEEHFRKTGPGSSGDLWTPVLGPSVLLNMEGEEHRNLRRRLTPLFSSGYTERLCERVLADPLARLDARLQRGDRVELVDTVRVMAGAVICELIGLDVQGGPDAREEAYRHYVHQGSQVISMVTMRTRRLSREKITKARAVLDPIADIAARAYAAGDESTVVGRMRGLGLSEQEARGATGAFFLTGTETVVTFVPRLFALLHDSDRLAGVAAALRAGDEKPLDAAIEEALRVTTPTPVMLRSVAAPTRIGSVAVRPGDRILIATHNCARAHGDFDPDRPHPPELRRIWFGAGPHFCIGHPLAMTETRAVARVVLRHAPLRILDRRAARGVLLPAYERLDIVSA